ncbi:MAG: phosphatase PAP2 family protein [Verrucomicrobiae bacterium]|nr:phosphatase PAP2 family protein [Verrucomicrobiae bacterium]
MKFLWNDIWPLLDQSWRILKKISRPTVVWINLGILLLFLLLLLLFPYDIPLQNAVELPAHSSLHALARQLSFWGDYPTGTLILCGLIYGAGCLWKKQQWKSAALAALLAASVFGLTANIFRCTLGRPRPHAQEHAGIRDWFYGPLAITEFHRFKNPSGWGYLHEFANTMNSYQSFPSGHAATAFATATALAITLPPVGLPVLIAAGGVAWSRMALSRHYPTDILAGALIGILGGLLFGTAARRLRSASSPA